MALRLLSFKFVDNETTPQSGWKMSGARRREDRLDAILRWVHRLLNPPPAQVPATASSRRRVRDRVPL